MLTNNFWDIKPDISSENILHHWFYDDLDRLYISNECILVENTGGKTRLLSVKYGYNKYYRVVANYIKYGNSPFQQVVYLLNHQILEGSLMLTITVHFGRIPT